jgi:hypothetical protein
MTKQLNTHQLDRLAEIKEEILDLLSEALDLARGTPEEQRANHGFATFCTALDKDNTQGSDSTITMQETIDALKGGAVFHPVGLGWHSRPFRLHVAPAPQ